VLCRPADEAPASTFCRYSWCVFLAYATYEFYGGGRRDNAVHTEDDDGFEPLFFF
jgi:hypothetical protein